MVGSGAGSKARSTPWGGIFNERGGGREALQIVWARWSRVSICPLAPTSELPMHIPALQGVIHCATLLGSMISYTQQPPALPNPKERRGDENDEREPRVSLGPMESHSTADKTQQKETTRWGDLHAHLVLDQQQLKCRALRARHLLTVRCQGPQATPGNNSTPEKKSKKNVKMRNPKNSVRFNDLTQTQSIYRVRLGSWSLDFLVGGGVPVDFFFQDPPLC